MRAPGRRDRLAEAIRQEVAGILRFHLADPRIARATVTRVAVSGDLGLARVYVSVLGGREERKETLTALRGARGRVRGLLGRRLRARVTPEVRFVFDPSVEFSIRLEQILEQERASSASEGAPRPGKSSSDEGEDG